jgi:hypothetical protein
MSGRMPDLFSKEFMSKTTFLSFPGLTGESRRTLDARLRTSGMTYKDVVCDVLVTALGMVNFYGK